MFRLVFKESRGDSIKKPVGYRKRLVEKQLDEYIESFGAVSIEGPKFCGKTWTGLSRSNSVIFMGDPKNNFQNRTLAKIDPSFVLEGERPHLIDEWQEVPELWDAVRFEVDKNQGKGKFILTVSSTPNHKGIMHSGTGRIGKIRMSTMSLFEIGDSSGHVSLNELFSGKFKPCLTGEVKLDDLISFVVRGGWPDDANLNKKMWGNTAREYLKTVVDDDMFAVDGVKRDVKKVWALLHSLGRNESTIVSNTTLRKDIENIDDELIDPSTISDYLNIFNRLFILDDQPSFNTKLRLTRRILKSPKRHFVDPSLAVAALGATKEMLFNDLNTFGFLFESLCSHDLKIYANYNNANLFHYRDEKGNEIDAIIELPDGRFGAFEIKLGTDKIDKAASDLIKFSSIMEKEGKKAPAILCVICGLTSAAYLRDDGVYVIPITALRE
ncbi:ATP-binding protein [Oceanivirga miroungae]|uniref:ATPase n=1 Tax=Oceanivirga miroungae TaxID=1130046 RepID=A0A6I8MAM8_9FUSO|nr:DUF4143 domain-containing protein [Oceanivirga miroungae]VWL85832.1 hypothetical protein OMES3154_01119 [Oceanivirga miroungae]